MANIKDKNTSLLSQIHNLKSKFIILYHYFKQKHQRFRKIPFWKKRKNQDYGGRNGGDLIRIVDDKENVRNSRSSL